MRAVTAEQASPAQAAGAKVRPDPHVYIHGALQVISLRYCQLNVPHSVVSGLNVKDLPYLKSRQQYPNFRSLAGLWLGTWARDLRVVWCGHVQSDDPLMVRMLRGEKVDRPPVWMMRQAGRYMKVYQDLCKKHTTFRERSENVDLAVRIFLKATHFRQRQSTVRASL